MPHCKKYVVTDTVANDHKFFVTLLTAKVCDCFDQ